MFRVMCWLCLTDSWVWMCPFFVRGSLSDGYEWRLNGRINRTILFIVHKRAEEKLLVFSFTSALRLRQKTCYYGTALYACACTLCVCLCKTCHCQTQLWHFTGQKLNFPCLFGFWFWEEKLRDLLPLQLHWVMIEAYFIVHFVFLHI